MALWCARGRGAHHPRAVGAGDGRRRTVCRRHRAWTQRITDLEIDRKWGRGVEPGVILADLHYAVEAKAGSIGADPNSLKLAPSAASAKTPGSARLQVRLDARLRSAWKLPWSAIAFRRVEDLKVSPRRVTGLLVGSEGTLAVLTNPLQTHS